MEQHIIYYYVYLPILLFFRFYECQNEIALVEEEVIIEPKPKTKIIIKKKVKKPLVIVEEVADHSQF